MEFVQPAKTGKRIFGILARATALSLTLFFIAAPTFAETIVIPNSLATVEGDTENEFPFSVPFSMRYQQVFAAQEFTPPSTPMSITQISFRPDSENGNPFDTTLTNIQINLSTTSAVPAGLSLTFADNVGSDDTVVFSGSLSLSSADTGPPGGPKDFDIIINLQTPFLYDPDSGNLLLDVRNFDGGTTTSFDSADAGSIYRVYTFAPEDATSPTAQQASSQGLVAQFTATRVARPTTTPAAVPSLPQWSLTGLICILLMAGSVGLRRRQK